MTRSLEQQPDLAPLTTAVAALDEQESLRLVAEAVASKLDSRTILQAVEEGMRVVGERYEAEEIFLAGLIMAGEIFRGAMALTRPGSVEDPVGPVSGRVLIGTVEGDIHDIGKNVTVLTLRSFGFSVRDLGVNVPAPQFLEEALAFAPDIIGLSGLLTVAFTAMRDTVTLLREHAAEFTVMPTIIIGGGTLDEHVARFIGADLWTTDAMHGVRLCEQVLETRRQI